MVEAVVRPEGYAGKPQQAADCSTQRNRSVGRPERMHFPTVDASQYCIGLSNLGAALRRANLGLPGVRVRVVADAVSRLRHLRRNPRMLDDGLAHHEESG